MLVRTYHKNMQHILMGGCLFVYGHAFSLHASNRGWMLELEKPVHQEIYTDCARIAASDLNIVKST